MSISEDTAAIVAAISSLTDAVGQLTGAVQGLRHTDRPVTSLGDLIGNMLSSIAQKVPIPPGFGEGTHPARGPDLDFDDALDVLKGHDDELCRCMHARRVHVGGDGPCVVGDAACICNTFTLLGPVEKVDEADEEDELAAARMKEMRPAITPIESGGTPCRVCGLEKKCQCLGVLMSSKPKETP